MSVISLNVLSFFSFVNFEAALAILLMAELFRKLISDVPSRALKVIKNKGNSI